MTDKTDATKPKAKRKLKEIDFSADTAHIAMVHKTQGGPANLSEGALIMKSVNYSEEFIQKMQKVQVTMEIPEFLQKFFGLWKDDAAVLAALMGYTESEGEDDDQGTYDPYESFWSWRRDNAAEGADIYSTDPTDEEYQQFVAAQLQGIEILKSVEGSKTQLEALTKLNEEQYYSLALVQEKVEKALRNEEAVKQAITKAAELKQNEVNMSKKTDAQPQEQKQEGEEMILKATFVDLEKAHEEIKKSLADTIVELEKAQSQIAEFQKKEQEAIQKARLDQLKEAMKDEAKAELLFKAVKDATQEDFDVVVKSLKELTAKVDDSEMFIEKGASGEGEGVEKESAVATILKARQAKQVK